MFPPKHSLLQAECPSVKKDTPLAPLTFWTHLGFPSKIQPEIKELKAQFRWINYMQPFIESKEFLATI